MQFFSTIISIFLLSLITLSWQSSSPLLKSIHSSENLKDDKFCVKFKNSELNRLHQDDQQDSYRLFSTKTAYLTAREEIRKVFYSQWPQKEIQRCSPYYFYLLSRHSIRYPSADDISEMDQWLHWFKNELLNSKKISYRLFLYLVTWRFRMSVSDDNHVSYSGKLETAKVAQYYSEYFPSLMDIENVDFEVGISSKIRTAETADAFIDSLIDKQITSRDKFYKAQIKGLKFKKKIKGILLSHKECKNYLKSNGSTIPESEDLQTLIKSLPIQEMLMEFSQRNGFSFTISIESIILLYKACAYETALFNFSPWCHLFTRTELIVIEYILDVDEYHDAYAIKAHREMACKVVNDFKSKLQSVIKIQSPGTLPYDVLCIPKNRHWRSSLVVPFGTNFAGILYKCPVSSSSAERDSYQNQFNINDNNEQFKLLTLFNEIPVIVKGCDDSFCDIDKFLNSHSQQTQSLSNSIECNLARICRI
ncbi:Thiamine-repressible acid phosphatase pho4 [Sarcoptes scabiei]|uniref:Multiple inositol polyphosphate phosphatase 1 n=1 Tax=Sarcoptes scabiei TaxID=52283 RepID=A0A834R1M2_SARSC|nr:Thiamine-repressible acid phosphatase pho4 [Sarcoptes scabiei]